MKTYLTAETSGVRLDSFIAANIENMSRSAISKLIEEGCVLCCGVPVKKSQKTEASKIYEIDIPEAEPVDITPQNIPLDIVYEDRDVIVVNKPKGMVVHPAPGHPDGTLVNALLFHCGDSLSGINGEIRPGIVHRIDMETSGLIIAAKNDTAHQRLSDQLKDHTLSRVYEAVVIGNIKESGTVNAPIGRHPTDRKRMAVTEKNSREAITHYEPIAHYSGYTHIRCRLETGRTHQIRVHMAHIGHPIYGDIIYGRKKPEKGLSGQCLHARELTFIHPASGEKTTVACPLPEYFTDVLKKLGDGSD